MTGAKPVTFGGCGAPLLPGDQVYGIRGSAYCPPCGQATASIVKASGRVAPHQRPLICGEWRPPTRADYDHVEECAECR